MSFELTPKEASSRMSLQYAKKSLLHEKDGAKLSEVAIKMGFNATELYFQTPEDGASKGRDSCRQVMVYAVGVLSVCKIVFASF